MIKCLHKSWRWIFNIYSSNCFLSKLLEVCKHLHLLFLDFLSKSESDHWNKIIRHGIVDFNSNDFHFRQFDKLDTESLSNFVVTLFTFCSISNIKGIFVIFPCIPCVRCNNCNIYLQFYAKIQHSVESQSDRIPRG